MFYRLNQLSVVDVAGKDADKILHNLTTNHVRALEVSTGCETFITDVRGKTLGHMMAYRNAMGYRLVGAAGQSDRVIAHADRYTIREDALPSNLDEQYGGLLVTRDSLAKLVMGPSEGHRDGEEHVFRQGAVEINGNVESAYEVPWLGGRETLLLIPTERVVAAVENLIESGIQMADEPEFHRRRTLAGMPWFGIDLEESHLPQEADRDAMTICFTKGCYLGQETIARLDALGQVQKKLVRWKLKGNLDGFVPSAGTTLDVDGKPVARLTSVAVDDEGTISAIAMTRRSHFASGATADGTDVATGQAVHGEVR